MTKTNTHKLIVINTEYHYDRGFLSPDEALCLVSDQFRNSEDSLEQLNEFRKIGYMEIYQGSLKECKVKSHILSEYNLDFKITENR